jgi:hypothetical protein
LSRENRDLLTRASEERAKQMMQNFQLAPVASRPWFLPFAEPDIHLLSQVLRTITED